MLMQDTECPSCGEEALVITENDIIFCEHCDDYFIFDEDGNLVLAQPGTAIPLSKPGSEL
jgi:hypothetical protein